MYANASTAASANAIPPNPTFDVDGRAGDCQHHVNQRTRQMLDQRSRVPRRAVAVVRDREGREDQPRQLEHRQRQRPPSTR